MEEISKNNNIIYTPKKIKLNNENKFKDIKEKFKLKKEGSFDIESLVDISEISFKENSTEKNKDKKKTLTFKKKLDIINLTNKEHKNKEDNNKKNLNYSNFKMFGKKKKLLINNNVFIKQIYLLNDNKEQNYSFNLYKDEEIGINESYGDLVNYHNKNYDKNSKEIDIYKHRDYCLKEFMNTIDDLKKNKIYKQTKFYN